MAMVYPKNDTTKATPSSFYEMPDEDLVAIQSRVNKETKRGRVQMLVRRVPDSEPIYSIIFQHRSKRATVTMAGKPTEGSVDEIIDALEAWTADAEMPQYTYDPPGPPASEWA